MKRFALAFVSLVLLLGLSACDSNAATQNDLKQYTTTLSGGDESIQNAILAAIETSEENNAQKITLTFLDQDGKETNVPAYSLHALNSPYRLRLDLGVSDCTAFDESEWELFGDIAGMFGRDAVGDQQFALLVQLSAPNDYDVAVSGNKLELTLAAGQEAGGEKYYAYVNAYDEYRYGAMPPGTSELTPSLCTDIDNRVMISKPYDTKEEAEEYAAKIQKIFDEEIPGKTVVTAALKGGALPEYSADLLQDEAAGKELVLKDGQKYTLPTVMVGGRFIAVSSDGKLLFAEAAYDGGNDGKPANETLSIIDTDNQKKRLSALTDIYTVDFACFSPDGKAICILEGSEETASLYYYEIESGALTNLTEEGLGYVSDFVFADDKTIYVLSEQIMKVEIGEEGFSYSAVLEEPANAGYIEYANEKIYYSDSELLGTGKVYVIDPATGSMNEFADGTRISIAPGGKHMAIIDDRVGEGEQQKLSLFIVDLETEEARQIEGVESISGYAWSVDGSKLYYSTPVVSGDFPNKLLQYDLAEGKSQEMMDILTGEFYAVDADRLFLVIGIGKGKSSATYELNVK